MEKLVNGCQYEAHVREYELIEDCCKTHAV